MELPPLPRLRKHKEANITTDVEAWFKQNWPRSCAVEVKIKGGQLKPHQKVALKEVADGAFTFKIPDMGRRNPFDFFFLKDADAVVVVCDGRDCIVYSHDKLTIITQFKL